MVLGVFDKGSRIRGGQTVSIHFTVRMMKHSISGQKKSEFRQRESQDFTAIRKPESVITSGSTVPVLAVHVLRFTMTAEKNTAVANRTVK